MSRLFQQLLEIVEERFEMFEEEFGKVEEALDQT